MKENNKNNGRGIFYGVIGVATLVVAIIGATFAYFTASATAVNNITGNMATISMDLSITKLVDPGETSGMIPMSNNMIETAVSGKQGETSKSNKTCVDDNGNAVCQIYKVTITNNSSATMFTDGYVALAGGSGTPKDYTATKDNKTTMRWAQVFSDDAVPTAESKFTTSGSQQLGSSSEKQDINSLDAISDTESGHNTTNIKTTVGDVTNDQFSISGNKYTVISKNFIRVSDHALETGIPSTTFTRAEDITSTLVLSQQLQPKGTEGNANSMTYYFVVWLSETGTNQNVAEEGASDTARATQAKNFFNGVVAFKSAQGSEVTATFSGYTAVKSDQKATTTQTQ